MKHIFLKETEVHETKEELYQTILNIMNDNHLPFQKKEMDRAYHLACRTYEGLKRYSGDDYVTHPLNTAILLAQMEAETSTIIAGMFCDALAKTNVSKESLYNALGEKAGDLISKAVSFDAKKPVESHQVLLIKLAERLHNMRTVEFMSSEEQKEKADETLAWFLPLAFECGDKRMIEELNDLSLKWIKNGKSCITDSGQFSPDRKAT
ncbi:HD domain-containing protein [Clostridium sp. MCC353]|uniref:HD domain-containing protein n=1 Tax=Clostridium sp. MCC353 TaxID=2592646 RepID=UPI00207988D0|nr:HD domain-containing protein [Clostridium sp. MCC353]